MKVIDKILNEWSFRCHDGIVDMNDPIKLSILNEIMLEEGIDDDIVDAVLNLSKEDPSSEEKKQKALAVLTGTSGDEKDKEEEEIKQSKDEVNPKDFKTIYNKIIPYLEEDKGLPDKETLALIAKFALKDEEEDLINYYKANHKFDINSNESILNVPISGGLKPATVGDVYKMFSGGAGGGKGVGKEEYFLVAFYSNVSKAEKKGDIIIDGQKYEVKGVGSMVTPSGATRGSKEDVMDLLTKDFIEKLSLDLPIEPFKENTRWIDTISDLYKEYKDPKEFLDKLQPVLNKKYPGLLINDEILKDPVKFTKEIAKNLISNFSTAKDEKIMFVSPDKKIKVYNTKEDLIKDVDDGFIKISAFSDFVPRLTLPKEKRPKPIKLSQPEIIKQKEEELENTIAQEKETIELKQKLDQAEAKLKDKKKEEPNRQFKFLEDELEKAREEYQNYVTKRKEELSRVRKDLTEELTNYLIKSMIKSIK